MAFPLSFGYAILRHRVFDLGVIFRRGLQYALARRLLLSVPPGLAAIGIYLCICHNENAELGKGTMQRKARIFMNNRSQAVRLPKEFQFNTQEVFIRKEGSDVVLSPRPFDWSSYLAEGPVASTTFMEGVEDLPVQEREP
jgi:antitoxin VapB